MHVCVCVCVCVCAYARNIERGGRKGEKKSELSESSISEPFKVEEKQSINPKTNNNEKTTERFEKSIGQIGV